MSAYMHMWTRMTSKKNMRVAVVEVGAVAWLELDSLCFHSLPLRPCFAQSSTAQSQLNISNNTYTGHGLHPGCGLLSRRRQAAREKRESEGVGFRECRGSHRHVRALRRRNSLGRKWEIKLSAVESGVMRNASWDCKRRRVQDLVADLSLRYL